jgi:hypothetical protein
MVSLKWGDVLSTLLPGAVALFAIAPYFPMLNAKIQKIDQTGPTTAVALLIASALAGGVLEAFTRIAWEPLWLTRRCKPTDVLRNLSADNLDLYERGVQSSYKYVTFYANFAWATSLLLFSRIQQHTARVWSIGSIVLIIAIVVLLRASHVQWSYYVNYQNKVFERRPTHAEE